MGSFVQIGLATAVVCLVTFGLGFVALRLVRTRSLRTSVVVASIVPLIAVSLAVITNVRLMFLSQHDSTAVIIALGCAIVIAIALSFVLGRRVTAGSRQLADALRGLGTDDGTAHLPARGPSEIAGLSEELAATRRRLDEEQRRARALEDSRRELVAFMSHDLRTPLAGLRALAEGLEDGVIDDQAAALRQVRQTVERMNGLVGDLFEVSRLHAGPSPEVAPRGMVSLVELSHDVIGELSAHAAQRGLALRLRVPDDDDRLAVRGNADELARALTNLVGNALRHTHPGGEVVLDAGRRPDGRITVGVTDACGGIDESDLGRVFDLGWRAEPERGTADAGAGLGLAIAKGVAEAHHGSIAVANVPGGCRFDLTLPGEASVADTRVDA